MMSQTAYFVKDIVSPNGAVSIVDTASDNSAEIEGHTKVGGLLVHRPSGDEHIALEDEPGHQALCDAEQRFVLRAILEDTDLTRHMNDAIQSLAICIAADKSIRRGMAVQL